MAFKMQLTDGATTIDIIKASDSTVGYHIQTDSYTPNINRRNPSGFGDTYLPVQESFTIAIVGSDANDVHVKLAALVNLIDNVRLWFDSNAAAADAINFIYKPEGSTEAVDYRSLVVGNATVNYSQYIERIGAWIRMPNISVSFMRNEWLGALDGETSALVVQPSVLNATFSTSSPLPSPVDIDIHITQRTPFGFVNDTLTVISNQEMVLFEAESLTIGAFAGTTAIAKASGGSVVHGTPNATVTPSPVISKVFAFGVDPFPFNNFTIYGTIRNKSATIPWSIETRVSAANGVIEEVQTIQLDTSTVLPRIVNFGSFYFDNLHSDEADVSISFTFDNPTVGTAADNFEFDCFVIVPLQSADTSQFTTKTTEQRVYGNSGRELSAPSGRVYGQFGVASPKITVPYTGLSKIKTLDTEIYAIHFFVYREVDGWRHTGGGNSTTHSLTATRRLASLSPK